MGNTRVMDLQSILKGNLLSDYAKQLLVSMAAVYPANIEQRHFEDMYFTHRQGLEELLEQSLLTIENEKISISDDIYNQVVDVMDMSYQAVDIAFNGRIADSFYVDPQQDNSHLLTLVPAAQALLQRYELADINIFTLANNLANFCYATGALDQALEARRQCQRLTENFDGFQFMHKVSDLYNLYQILLALGEKEEARSSLIKAMDILKAENQTQSNEFATLKENLQALA